MEPAEILCNEAKKHQHFIKYSIRRMTDEFNRYIKIWKEVPWWFNERAMLGFYASGLVRNGKAVVLQEFSCRKAAKKRSGGASGRADLWIQSGEEKYIAEAKLWFSSIDTKKDIGESYSWAETVLRQANEYDVKDYKVKKRNVYSLCFEVILCTRKKFEDYDDKIRRWSDDAEAFQKLDFYTVIHLSSDWRDRVNHIDGNYYHPAVAVYGLFGG